MAQSLITIENDPEGVYEQGRTLCAITFVDDYCECASDTELITWLHNIDIRDAVDFVAGAWGIDYDFIE